MYVELLHHIIVEVPPLLDESDLHIAQYTLVILKSIAEYHPRALQDLPNNIFPQILVLVKSPLLQGIIVQFNRFMFDQFFQDLL
jgi:cullin-associated NEDD8-dissociated protein 1